MFIQTIDIENIVTMLNTLPKQTNSERIKFARGSNKLITTWSEFKKHLFS
jgi:hypothetical protein